MGVVVREHYIDGRRPVLHVTFFLLLVVAVVVFPGLRLLLLRGLAARSAAVEFRRLLGLLVGDGNRRCRCC